jgi:transcriptional repressor NrdR
MIYLSIDMFCPFCHSNQIIVTNSRPTSKNTQIWRRRKCLKCGEVFTTREKIDISYVVVEKRDNRRVQYSRPKLYSGIYHALVGRKHIDRGNAGEIAENIIQKVEEYLVSQKIKEIKSTEIVWLVVRFLSKQYPDIALRYLAYFNHYSSIEEYLKKIKLVLLPKKIRFG